jgi:hypothetical protein
MYQSWKVLLLRTEQLCLQNYCMCFNTGSMNEYTTDWLFTFSKFFPAYNMGFICLSGCSFIAIRLASLTKGTGSFVCRKSHEVYTWVELIYFHAHAVLENFVPYLQPRMNHMVLYHKKSGFDNTLLIGITSPRVHALETTLTELWIVRTSFLQ